MKFNLKSVIEMQIKEVEKSGSMMSDTDYGYVESLKWVLTLINRYKENITFNESDNLNNQSLHKHWDWRTSIRMGSCGKNCYHNRPKVGSV